MATTLKGRHRVPKSVYDRNQPQESAEEKAEREARRKAAAEQVAAEQRALEARIAAEQAANAGLAEPTRKRGKLIFVKDSPPPHVVTIPDGRVIDLTDWCIQDVYDNLRAGYTPEFVAWRTKYPLDQVLAIADDL